MGGLRFMRHGEGRRRTTTAGGLLLSVMVAVGLSCAEERATPAPRPRETTGAVPTRPQPSVVLISIDTTRADRLGCYGRSPSPTPNIDRWAEQGVVFEHALTPVPVTLPAHTTLLSGRLPHRHGVRDNGVYRVATDVPTLAESLSAGGYDTAAVVGAAVLDRQFGLGRGFRIYDDVSAGGGLAIAERPAEDVTTAALAAARQLEAPFFLFVHYFDPHATYTPPRAYAERFPSEPYLGEIAYVDEQIGRLRRGLFEDGLRRDTVVVITSDHGESLGEHGEATHGVFLYQSTLHVPLILVAPGRWTAGGRVTTPASLADVAPTLLALTGQPSLDEADGHALSEPGSETAPARWLPLESEFGLNSYGWAPLVGLTDGHLKWIGAPRPELYDLEKDPEEEHDLSATRAHDARRLAELWREKVREDRRSLPADVSGDREQAERLERLAALGYVAGSAAPRPADPGALPDPKDVIGSLRLINEERGSLGRGRLDEAQRTLQLALKQSPRNVSALVLLGARHILAGQPRAAIEPLERAARLSPANAEVQANLGLAFAGVGDARSAEAAFRRALLLAPRTHDAAVNLADLLVNTGRPAEAQDVIRQARQEGLASPALDYLGGSLAAARGDSERARHLLQSALDAGLPPAAATRARALLKALSEASGSPPGA